MIGVHDLLWRIPGCGNMHGSVFLHIIADLHLVSHLILLRLFPGHDDLGTLLFAPDLVGEKNIKGRRLFRAGCLMVPHLFDGSRRLLFIIFNNAKILKKSG